MSEQNQRGLTFEELLESGGLDLGGTDGDYDPFAENDNPFAAQTTDPEELGDEVQPDDQSDLDNDGNVTDFPPQTTQGAVSEQPEISTPSKTAQAPAKPAPAKVVTPDFNPLAAAVNKAEEQTVRAGAASILAKPPVFTFGDAKEEITDVALTFEQLRINKAEDFPELDDQKKVSWTMEYGKISKQVPKPKETVIHKLKEEIETSKEFLELLGKQKDKPETLICKVKPRITAQSKGVICAYKGVFTSMEEAEQSDKAIKLLPSRDGKVYEIRCTEAGKFIAPVTNVPELSEVSAGFFPALPPIPFPLLCQVIGFFRHFMEGGQEMEAMVQLFWDKELLEYRIVVPHQQVGKAHIEAQLDPEDALDEDRYFCFADIHSHNSMKAFFSAIDDRDEKATRVYMVMGRLDHYFPEINTRISCGGHFLPIAPSTVIGDLPGDFPVDWLQNVEAGSKGKEPRYLHDYFLEGVTL